jgi:cobalt-precorrin-5B (C1)-methyltransferase
MPATTRMHAWRASDRRCRILPQRAGESLLKGGFGVGVVTKDGLGLEVGGPAINPVPQRNIRDNVRAVAGELLAHDGLEVTISVPAATKWPRRR